jgi:hypothetical protein
MDKQHRKDIISAYKERPIIGGVYGIKNMVNGKMLLLSTADLQGAKNRFQFCQLMNSCTYIKLQNDWKHLGAKSFVFETLEELKMQEGQTTREFKAELKVLEELWLEKLDGNKLY